MAQYIRFFDVQHPLYRKALTLRYEVLRKPLGLEFAAKELEKDEADVHFALLDEAENVLACLTLTFDTPHTVKVRQVAVDEQFRGQGFGKKLSAAAEKYAKEKGVVLLHCHARKTAVPFYCQLGFAVVGEEFEEVGLPHFRMEKTIC